MLHFSKVQQAKKTKQPTQTHKTKQQFHGFECWL